MEKIKGFLKNNWYSVFAYRLLLAMLLFSICRLIFFTYNKDLFSDTQWLDFARMALGGLKFDLVAVLYANILFILLSILPFPFRYNIGYQKALRIIFVVCNSIILLSYCIDIVYFRFTLRLTTFSVFREFSNETEGFSLVFHFLATYWYIPFLVAFFAYLLWKCFGSTNIARPAGSKPYLFYIYGIIIMALSIGLFIAGVRGGFRHSTRPITLSNAGDFAKKPIEVNIVLNTPFCIMKTMELTDLERKNFFTSESELNKVYTPIHAVQSPKTFTPLNVVVIILESNAKEYYGFYNRNILNGKYKGYTPFMDSLIDQSLTFQYSYASGQKSIDAMPSVLTSIPYMVEPFITTRYANNNLNSLASLLKTKGYYSAFFHGAPNGSMGFQAFANLVGYDQYFGKTEYNNDNDFDNIWGIWDEEFFQFFANKMNTFKQPFLSTIFSVSSHDPFKVPTRYKGKFPKGTLPIHQCIGYTDNALRQFFNKASKTPWFKNTLFVITADHTSQKYLEEYKNDLDHFAVPIVFYCPTLNLKNYDRERIVQQIDIMPSVLGLLNFDKPYVAFGNNIFSTQEQQFVINYKNGFYQLVYQNYLLRFDGQKSVGLFNFKKDRLLTKNLLATDTLVAQQLEQKCKAFIQQYNNRMLDNKLIAH